MQHISQIQLISDIQEMLGKKYPDIKLNTRQFNAVIKASTILSNELNKETQHAGEDIGLVAWLASDDVGMSSKYMAQVLADIPGEREYAHPYDPSDFKRCQKLLISVPALKERLNLMAKESEVWAGLVEDWDEISRLIDNDKGKEAYHLIKRLH
jgi:hypothetical protein